MLHSLKKRSSTWSIRRKSRKAPLVVGLDAFDDDDDVLAAPIPPVPVLPPARRRSSRRPATAPTSKRDTVLIDLTSDLLPALDYAFALADARPASPPLPSPPPLSRGPSPDLDAFRDRDLPPTPQEHARQPPPSLALWSPVPRSIPCTPSRGVMPLPELSEAEDDAEDLVGSDPFFRPAMFVPFPPPAPATPPPTRVPLLQRRPTRSRPGTPCDVHSAESSMDGHEAFAAYGQHSLGRSASRASLASSAAADPFYAFARSASSAASLGHAHSHSEGAPASPPPARSSGSRYAPLNKLFSSSTTHLPSTPSKKQRIKLRRSSSPPSSRTTPPSPFPVRDRTQTDAVPPLPSVLFGPGARRACGVTEHSLSSASSARSMPVTL